MSTMFERLSNEKSGKKMKDPRNFIFNITKRKSKKIMKNTYEEEEKMLLNFVW